MDELIASISENYGVIAGAAVLILLFIGALIGNLIKDLINIKNRNKYDEKLKTLENQYSLIKQLNEHNLATERYSLQLVHSNLIEKRALIIDDIYKLLVELHEEIYSTVRPDYFGREKPSKQLAYERALPKFDSFIDKFEKNKIYLSSETSQKISKFYNSAARALDQARIVFNSSESISTDISPEIQKLYETISSDMEKARETVEYEFRNILYPKTIK